MRSLLTRTLVLCAAALIVAGCGGEEKPAQVSRTLPNGIRVLARENRASSVVAVQAWVADGSLYETPQEAGSAYLLAQMMFRHTPEYEPGDIQRTIEGLGGSFSVNPRQDFVEYAAVAPSRQFDVLADLFADGLQNAVFDSSYFEQVKARAIETLQSIDKRPMERAHQMCISTLLGDHPYGRPTQGTVQTVRAATLDDIRRRYEQRYVGSNLLISVAGDIDPSAAADAIEARLSGVERGQEAEPEAAPVEWPSSPIRTVHTADVRTGYQVMCFPAPSIRDPDAITMDVLLMILTGGRSSRLSRTLVEQDRLVNAVDAGWYTLRQPSPLFVWMELRPDDAGAAEQAVLTMFQGLAANGVTERELEKAKTYWKTQIYFMTETAEGQAFYDAYWTFLGWPDLPREYLESIDDVTAEDVRAAAQHYLSGDSYSTSLLIPTWANE